jgi:hypothetical protein
MTPHPLQTLDPWAANSVAAAHGLREFPVHEGLGGLVGVAGEDAITMRTRVFQSDGGRGGWWRALTGWARRTSRGA